MEHLIVNILRYVDDYFPGWVECEFVDADGRRHIVVEKVPGVSLEDLDATSKYPQVGSIRCEVLDRWRDDRGRDLVRVTSQKPDGIESTEGVSEFVVLSGQLMAIPDESK